MRELKRSIARHLMKRHGIEKINKKRFLVVNKDGSTTGKRQSYFARYWRDYVDPNNRKHKRAVREMGFGH